MLFQIPGVLSGDRLSQSRRLLDGAEWVDGKGTAGYQSAQAKNNLQLRPDDPVAEQIGDWILEALGQHPLFIAAALPARIFPPLFNRYQGGQAFGTHVDNAIRQVTGTPHRIRTDVSATLFLTDPAEYEGGELMVEDTYGVQQVKLPAGSMVIYPSTSLHHVRPVTRGARVASFFWIQSMIRDDGQRTVLFDLDMAIQRMTQDVNGHPALVQLTGVYHNLLRRWAEVA